MQALVVVLDDDLPVGLDLVDDAPADAQLVQAVALEAVIVSMPSPQLVEERSRGVAEVDEQEPAVGLDGDRVEREVAALEALVLVDVGRADEPAVEVERPGVVRALEGLADVAAGRAGRRRAASCRGGRTRCRTRAARRPRLRAMSSDSPARSRTR